MRPDIAVLTHVPEVPVHVEFFSSPEEVVKEKRSLVEYLRPGGTLVLFGWANMAKHGQRKMTHVLGQFAHVPLWTPMKLMQENKGVSGVNMGHLWGEREMMAKAFASVLALYRGGAIRPHVDRSFPFHQAGEAHAYIESGQNLGKVLLIS